MTESNYGVTPQELIDHLAKGAVTLLDVRNEAEFNRGHIENSIHFPLDRLLNLATSDPYCFNLSKDSLIVSVCGKGGGRSEKAAELLRQLGWTKSYWLVGGFVGWTGEPKT